MPDATPSRTAMRVALRRAAHQLVDAPPVLDDPLALAIIGADGAETLKSEIDKELTQVARSLRAFMAVRSRFAEDALARAVARGVRQYVVLGAGLDTFAYRKTSAIPGLRVFEVDDPATQAWKREMLAAAAIAVPASVTYAPVNVEQQTLADGLTKAGVDRGAPAFFSWLGVTMYLSEAAIASTFAYVASMPAGSGIAFDYAMPREQLGLIGRMALDAVAKRVAAAGEPFTTFFDPATLDHKLREAGFRAIEDLGRDAINARYFAGRADGLRVSGQIGRVVSAEV